MNKTLKRPIAFFTLPKPAPFRLLPPTRNQSKHLQANGKEKELELWKDVSNLCNGESIPFYTDEEKDEFVTSSIAWKQPRKSGQKFRKCAVCTECQKIFKDHPQPPFCDNCRQELYLLVLPPHAGSSIEEAAKKKIQEAELNARRERAIYKMALEQELERVSHNYYVNHSSLFSCEDNINENEQIPSEFVRHQYVYPDYLHNAYSSLGAFRVLYHTDDSEWKYVLDKREQAHLKGRKGISGGRRVPRSRTDKIVLSSKIQKRGDEWSENEDINKQGEQQISQSDDEDEEELKEEVLEAGRRVAHLGYLDEVGEKERNERVLRILRHSKQSGDQQRQLPNREDQLEIDREKTVIGAGINIEEEYYQINKNIEKDLIQERINEKEKRSNQSTNNVVDEFSIDNEQQRVNRDKRYLSYQQPQIYSQTQIATDSKRQSAQMRPPSNQYQSSQQSLSTYNKVTIPLYPPIGSQAEQILREELQRSDEIIKLRNRSESFARIITPSPTVEEEAKRKRMEIEKRKQEDQIKKGKPPIFKY